jgi:hypothetical protein
MKPDLFSSFVDFDKKVFAAAIAMGSLEPEPKPAA